MKMTKHLELTKRLAKAASLGAAVIALGLSATKAAALEIWGLIKVNGAEMSGVAIAAYDCADSAYLGLVYSGATDSSSGSPVNFYLNVPVENVRLELYYADVPGTPFSDQCRAFVNCGEVVPVDGKALVNADMTCGEAPVAPGVEGHGYWKNHPEAWPVDSLVIGNRTFSKARILFFLRLPEKGDKTKHLFREIVAAKLNVAAGNDDSCIQDAIVAVDACLARFPVCSGVRASSLTWKKISAAVKRLSGYNEGLLCAPAGEPDSIHAAEGSTGVGLHERRKGAH